MGELTWRSFVDYVVARKNVENCMIVSAEDASHWASNSDFMLKEYIGMVVQEDGSELEETINEAVNLLKILSGTNVSQGLRLNCGRKQQILRAFQDNSTGLYSIYGKYIKGGSCIVKSSKCIVIGTFNETLGQTAAACNDDITEISKYLASVKWPVTALVRKDDPGAGGGGGGGGEDGTPEASWRHFIDEMLIKRGNVSDAVICSSKDGKVYAATPNFTLKTYKADIVQEDGSEVSETVNEAANLVKLMQGGAKPAQGLRLNGEKKYQIIRSFTDDATKVFLVYGKKTQGGCCVAVTNSAIVVGVFNEAVGHTSAACNQVVTELAAYLKGLGK